MASPVQGLWLGGVGFASQLATGLPELQRCSSCGRRAGAMSATVCLVALTLALLSRAIGATVRYVSRRATAKPAVGPQIQEHRSHA